MRIYKYPLEIIDLQEIALPCGAKILTVQEQHDTLQLWAIVDPYEKRYTIRTIEIIGTGNPMSCEACEYISTVIQQNTHFVWHVFEKLANQTERV